MSGKSKGRAIPAARPSDDVAPSSVDASAAAAAEALSAWPDRLAEMLATRKARTDAQRAFRADHERRRQYAHPKRHAAKLGR